MLTRIGIPIITAVLSALGNVDNTLLRTLSYVSPYRYLNLQSILEKGRAEARFVIPFVAIMAVFFAAAFVRYNRREFST